MLTPISTASTAAGPPAATSGSNTRVAGMLLTRLARAAATAAIPSSAGSPEPDGSTVDMAVPTPLSMTACPTTPSASTKTRNATFAERMISVTDVWPRPRLRSASSATPAASAITNPARVSATTTNTNTGGRGGGPSCSGSGATRRSRAKNHRNTT